MTIFDIIHPIGSAIAQEVEQVAVNHRAAGSSPARGAIFNNTNCGFSEREMEVPFSLLSPPEPTPEDRIESLKASKFSK